MVKPIPSRFNPDLLARDSTQYSGNLPRKQFIRLQEFLLDDSGEMQATFRFSRRKKTVMVSGQLTANYRLQCQRCLEPMQFAVDEAFEFVFAKTEEEAQRVPERFDPVVVDDNGQIHIIDLFEDELILYLPTVARHETSEQCEASGYILFIDDAKANSSDGLTNEQAKERTSAIVQSEKKENADSDVENGRKNPFHVLKKLDLH